MHVLPNTTCFLFCFSLARLWLTSTHAKRTFYKNFHDEDTGKTHLEFITKRHVKIVMLWQTHTILVSLTGKHNENLSNNFALCTTVKLLYFTTLLRFPGLYFKKNYKYASILTKQLHKMQVLLNLQKGRIVN